ncbi:fructosamine kinase family protein [Kaarinaea lacus]
MSLTTICQHISETTGEAFSGVQQSSVGGGCINSAYVLSDSRRSFFVKTNGAERMDMFAAEFDGLNEINQANCVKAPQPVCVGKNHSNAYIVMEYIAIGNSGGKQSIEALGHQLASMHRGTKAQYGWFRDNTIGSTEQINDYSDTWLSFFREQRLRFQLQLAARHGHRGRLQQKGEQLLAKIDAFFNGYTPQASLLHGDLWSGNYAFTKQGEPVIFDPAVYYGDREADIAMTELFGGFPQYFYAAYNESYALDPGYATRKNLYNLYHILNHANMFGGGYVGQSERMIEQLLSEV